MNSAQEIFEYIDSIAPFESAMSFDNPGLLIGDKNVKASEVLLALDITTEVINEAVQKKVPVIVTHHPTIFNPLKKISSDSLQYKLIRAGITVISAHTNLDICPEGVNDTLARAAGLILTHHTNEDCYVTGELECEMTAGDYAAVISEKLGCKGMRYTERRGKVKKVTVSCGAGGSSIFAAAGEGADALITGEIKHHELLFARENNIAVFDIGHFRSEDMMMEKLAQLLSAHFPETKFEKAESDTEEIIYLSS